MRQRRRRRSNSTSPKRAYHGPWIMASPCANRAGAGASKPQHARQFAGPRSTMVRARAARFHSAEFSRLLLRSYEATGWLARLDKRRNNQVGLLSNGPGPQHTRRPRPLETSFFFWKLGILFVLCRLVSSRRDGLGIKVPNSNTEKYAFQPYFSSSGVEG